MKSPTLRDLLRPKKMNNKICFMERDRDILIFLFRNKVASFNQIHRYYFENTSKQICSRRLNKLLKSRLIEKRAILTKKGREVFFNVSGHGIKAIDEFLDHDINSKNYTSDSIQHDLVLTDITKRFEKMSVVLEVLTESQLQSCSAYMDDSSLLPFIDLRSDRVCVIKGETKNSYAAIEYERSLKENSRNKSKIDAYYNNYSVPAVFYICQSRSLLNSLKKIDKERSEKEESKLYFCEVADVQSSSSEITFTRHDGEQLTFR